MGSGLDGETKKPGTPDGRIICILFLIGVVMMPFTSGISLFLMLALVSCYGCVIACEKGAAEQNELMRVIARKDTALQEQEVSEGETSPEDSDAGLLMDRYVFPSKCPQCLTELNLDEMKWVDTNSALCPNCEILIEAEKI